MMTNSVCLPSADLGFGLGVPSPKRILNFSFKPESLLVGLAIVGRNALEDPSVPRKQAQRFQEQLHTPAPSGLQLLGTLGLWWVPFLPEPWGRIQPPPAVLGGNKSGKRQAARP